MKKIYSLIAVLMMVPMAASAQPQMRQMTPEMKAEMAKRAQALAATFPQPDFVVDIWPDGAPSDNGLTGEEIDYGNRASNITKPQLSVFVPENPNGLAVIVCPGGAYIDVWFRTEGYANSKFFTDQGITYMVLKYRLPNGHSEVPLEDLHQAMRVAKSHTELGIKKLGVMGCSAGGHLASTAATHYDSPELRPDFQILLYPVISMDSEITHGGSKDNLLGKNPSREAEDLYSNEKQVTADTPMAFIVANTDDNVVPVANSMNYYQALIKNKVPATMMVCPTGGHGWCDSLKFPYRAQWLNHMTNWFNAMLEKL